MLTIGKRIKKLRESLHLSQYEFAKRLGVTSRTVINYETEKISPKKSILNAISKIFNASIDWLERGEGEMFREPSLIREPPPAYATPTIEKIVRMLEGMTPDEQKEILKYLKEKKLIKDLLKERAEKKDLQK